MTRPLTKRDLTVRRHKMRKAIGCMAQRMRQSRQADEEGGNMADGPVREVEEFRNLADPRSFEE